MTAYDLRETIAGLIILWLFWRWGRLVYSTVKNMVVHSWPRSGMRLRDFNPIAGARHLLGKTVGRSGRRAL